MRTPPIHNIRLLVAATPDGSSYFVHDFEDDGADGRPTVMHEEVSAEGSRNVDDLGMPSPEGAGLWVFEGTLAGWETDDPGAGKDYGRDIAGTYRRPTPEELELWHPLEGIEDERSAYLARYLSAALAELDAFYKRAFDSNSSGDRAMLARLRQPWREVRLFIRQFYGQDVNGEADL